MDRIRELVEREKTIKDILNLPSHRREKILSQLRMEDPLLALEVEEEIKKREEKRELIRKAKQAGITKIGGFSIDRFIEEEFDIDALKEYLDDYFAWQRHGVYVSIIIFGAIIFSFIVFVISPAYVIISIPLTILLIGTYIFYRGLRLQYKFSKIKKSVKR